MGVTDEQISRVSERGSEGAADRRKVDHHRRQRRCRGPVDREDHRLGRGRLPRAGHRGPGRRGRRRRGLGRNGSTGPRGDPPQGVRTAHRTRRGHRPADDPGNGQAAGRGPRRGHLRRRVLPLVQRGSRPDRRPVLRRPVRRHPPADHEAARRTGLRDHPVELPARHGHPQDRSRARRRLHRRDQAGRPNPFDHTGSRRCADRGRAAGRGRQRHHHLPVRARCPGRSSPTRGCGN